MIYYEYKPYHSNEPVILAEKIIATDDPSNRHAQHCATLPLILSVSFTHSMQAEALKSHVLEFSGGVKVKKLNHKVKIKRGHIVSARARSIKGTCS